MPEAPNGERPETKPWGLREPGLNAMGLCTNWAKSYGLITGYVMPCKVEWFSWAYCGMPCRVESVQLGIDRLTV